MVPANLVFLLAFSPLVFDLDFASSRQISENDALPSQSACVNCTICPYPCHNLSPPPPPSGYPLYGAPPPPVSGYPSYGAPPPPQAQGNCPPVPVQCCRSPPPNTYTYLPNDSFSPFPYPTICFILILLLLVLF